MNAKIERLKNDGYPDKWDWVIYNGNKRVAMSYIEYTTKKAAIKSFLDFALRFRIEKYGIIEDK